MVLDAVVWSALFVLVALVSFLVGRGVGRATDTAPLEDGRAGPRPEPTYTKIRKVARPYDWQRD